MRLIAHISDLHFGRHDPKIVEGLLESIASHRPDLVVVSGDLTQRARRSEFAAARQFLDRIETPRLVVPGNHDIPLYGLVERFVAPFGAYQRLIAPAALPDGTYIDAEIAALGINTVRRSKWKEGRISHLQMARIQSTLGPPPPHVFKIVVTHHPVAAMESSSYTLAGRSALALRTMANANVHLLLSGHHHHAISGQARIDMAPEKSLIAIHAGTAVSTRTRAGGRNSYNLLRLDSPHLAVSVQEWAGGSGFREASLVEYVLESGRWRTRIAPKAG